MSVIVVSQQSVARMRTSRVDRVVAHIEANFEQKIVLRDLADLAELSVHRFATVFRREVGLPPHRYLSHVRVRHAKRLLCQGLPPAVAAVEAGFYDQSHLARHFKHFCGVTPGEYQSRHRRTPEVPRAAGPRRRYQADQRREDPAMHARSG
jgi:AraC-like DNA-binding protein